MGKAVFDKHQNQHPQIVNLLTSSDEVELAPEILQYKDKVTIEYKDS